VQSKCPLLPDQTTLIAAMLRSLTMRPARSAGAPSNHRALFKAVGPDPPPSKSSYRRGHDAQLWNGQSKRASDSAVGIIRAVTRVFPSSRAGASLIRINCRSTAGRAHTSEFDSFRHDCFIFFGIGLFGLHRRCPPVNPDKTEEHEVNRENENGKDADI